MEQSERAPPSRLDRVRALVCWGGVVGIAVETIFMAPDPDVSPKTITIGLAISSLAVMQGVGPVMRIRAEVNRPIQN